jgi:hypothetical protein
MIEWVAFTSALLQVFIFYFSLIAAYLVLKYFSRVGDILSGGGRFIVFGAFTFSVATFFAYFQLAKEIVFPLVVELLYLASLLFTIAGFRIELKQLETG